MYQKWYKLLWKYQSVLAHFRYVSVRTLLVKIPNGLRIAETITKIYFVSSAERTGN